MAGDSAFRRLLLDTVSSVIGQPPSASALIELLRIATPKLQRGKQAEAKVRDASQRAKLLKVLQLRIHPDKHAGDETVTEIFQKVTTFYENCVDEMEKEDARRRWSSSASAGRNDINESKGVDTTKEKASPGNSGNGRTNASSTAANDRNPYPQWSAAWCKHNRDRDEENAHPGNRGGSDYHNCDDADDERRQSPIRRKQRDDSSRNHEYVAAVSAMVMPPLGLFALYHSYMARRAWKDGRRAEALEHSDRAHGFAWFGIACFACFCSYLLLKMLAGGDERDEGGWNWDEMKRNWGWYDSDDSSASSESSESNDR